MLNRTLSIFDGVSYNLEITNKTSLILNQIYCFVLSPLLSLSLLLWFCARLLGVQTQEGLMHACRQMLHLQLWNFLRHVYQGN